MKRSKKYNEVAAKVIKDHLYTPLQAVTLAKETTTTKYDSTIDVALVLGVDPKKADQAIRSTVNLPHGTWAWRHVQAFRWKTWSFGSSTPPVWPVPACS